MPGRSEDTESHAVIRVSQNVVQTQRYLARTQGGAGRQWQTTEKGEQCDRHDKPAPEDLMTGMEA